MSDGLVTVTAGGNSEPFPGLVGKTVAEVRQAFQTLYNISEDASATINNRDAAEDETLRQNDNIVFGKPVARKG